MTNNQNLTYRFNNGVPNQLTESISPWVNDARVALGRRCSCRTSGRVERLTLQGAVRFDRAVSWFPEQQEGPSQIPADADRHPRDARRRQLQGHHAENGRGLRPVRATAGRRSR